MCSKGEIDANMDTNLIRVAPFGQQAEIYDIKNFTTDLSGHSGGDNKMLEEMFDNLDKGKCSEDMAESIHSHMIAFAAEESRETLI